MKPSLIHPWYKPEPLQRKVLALMQILGSIGINNVSALTVDLTKIHPC